MSQLKLTQLCPVCCRTLFVGTELVGRQVICSHCHSQFRADDNQVRGGDVQEREESLTDRAERILTAYRSRHEN